ncbi:MAG: DUF2848 family protein [Planctomycetota bacterium]|jgi:4-hydroxyphenylacetate 3-monooxygenase
MDIEVSVEGVTSSRVETLHVGRMYNLGSATRESATARPHQEEVAEAGIFIAFDVPAPRIYPIANHALTTEVEIGVQGAESSGEVEIVLHMGDRLYVGVGSDHTDRALERTSIPWSKQACPNVLAPAMWPFEDVRDHWDDMVLRSWVDGRLYQEIGVSAFLHPDRILEILAERVRELPARDYMVFMGTIASVDKALGFGKTWSFEMADPALSRKITHGYRVANLFDEIHDDYRVPLINPPSPAPPAPPRDT